MKIAQRRTKLWWGIGLGMLLVAAAIASGIFIVSRVNSPQKNEPAVSENITKPKPVSLTANTLYTGNIYWGRYVNEWAMASPLKMAYPFSRLNEFHRESYDAWITGLECPTVAGFSQTPAQENATLSFNCSPDYLPEAAKWFTVTTLANNHTDNRGAAGFEETKKHLDANGIQYFGHYDPMLKDEACEVIALPVMVAYDNNEKKRHSLPVAMCGFHGVFKVPPPETIAQISQYAELMSVIALPHMGAEYTASPDALKVATYRSMIDAGADMVLGDHPHWIQPTESYKGKLIVYSMGNFMFDQQGEKELTRSAAIRVVMNTTRDVHVDNQLEKWLALGDSCKTFKDTCLSTAKAQQLKELGVNYQFGVVGSNDDNKITKPASESEQAAILQRLNWNQTMNLLQPPQSSL